MPPKKARAPSKATLKKEIQNQIGHKTEQLIENLEALKISERLKGIQTIKSVLPAAVLNLKLKDVLQHANFVEFLEEACNGVSGFPDEKMPEAEHDDPAEAMELNVAGSPVNDENMSAPVSRNEHRRRLKTPLGVELPVPDVIRPKIEAESIGFRLPKVNEEIAFSMDGSPLVINGAAATAKANPKLERIRPVLEAQNAAELSPTTRELADAVHRLIARQEAKAGLLKPKIERETGV
ncbi:unnamed protein product [Caenorhabditis bovis]|uniref:Uncharacterized protein n=1 Tax=Caenorhabditis bovis TaxID=2654633 RepID=A0A8S1F6C2_9PELO|nr:unnamed protein product [Caenorhabditis bovis]